MSSTQLARKLRHTQTKAESLLWSRLRDRQLNGAKFKRQFRIDRFVVDFFCFEARLVIELDGGQDDALQAKDLERTEKIEALGYRVVRFWNNDVDENIEGVLQTIAAHLKSIG